MPPHFQTNQPQCQKAAQFGAPFEGRNVAGMEGVRTVCRIPVHGWLFLEKLSFKIEKPITTQNWDTSGHKDFARLTTV